MRILRYALILLLGWLPVYGGEWSSAFDMESLPMPEGIDPQVGGMDCLADGRLAVAFHRGEVMIYDPVVKRWSLFGVGLHEPLGLLVDTDGSILVMQRPELTRLVDRDGDGRADRYETVYDGFGMTGNYHEFAYGPVKDAEGNYYISLNLASNGAPVRAEVRGKFSGIGKLTREQMTDPEDWRKLSGAAGRMYSRVPYRGWVMKLSADFKKVEPYASGFRSPDGIGIDARGRLLMTDNQGDWRPTSPIYVVEKGGFYGHPASLVWTPGWSGRDPMSISAKELDALGTPAAGYFPQGELANSPTQPVAIPKGALPEGWVGQTLVGEMNQPQMIRVLDDEVEGVPQMGLVPFLDGSRLGKGNHRLAFAPDGSLYIGKTALSWAGGSGITRVKWNGKPLFCVERIAARVEGFLLRFSQAVDEESLSGLRVTSHTYAYHKDYGAPKKDESVLAVVGTSLSTDGKELLIRCGPLKERYLHLLDMSAVRSREGVALSGDRVWYHMVKVPK